MGGDKYYVLDQEYLNMCAFHCFTDGRLLLQNSVCSQARAVLREQRPSASLKCCNGVMSVQNRSIVTLHLHLYLSVWNTLCS